MHLKAGFTRPDMFGTGTKLVQLSITCIRDLADQL